METSMTSDLLRAYKEAMELDQVDPRSYSPLVLAYIGDSVYEVMIRMRVINGGNTQVNKLHRRASRLVCAGAQSAMMGFLEGELTPEELSVFKRGRNSHSASSAKNASITDYRRATGFEALVGWLFLTEQFGRLVELVSLGLRGLGELSGNKTGSGECLEEGGSEAGGGKCLEESGAGKAMEESSRPGKENIIQENDPCDTKN